MRHLLGIGVLATIADAATTWLAVQLAAVNASIRFMEVNPLVDSVLDAAGPAWAMALRAAVGVGLFGFLGWATRRSRFGLWPLGLATSLTCLVVTWNVWLLQAHL